MPNLASNVPFTEHGMSMVQRSLEDLYLRVEGGTNDLNADVVKSTGGLGDLVATADSQFLGRRFGTTGFYALQAQDLGATPAAAKLLLATSATSQDWFTLSGDATISAAGALTLANAGTAGTTGAASTVPVITVDVKGRVTAVGTATITPAAIGAVDSATYASHAHNLAGDVGGTTGATVIGAGKVLTAMVGNNAIGAAQIAQFQPRSIIGNTTASIANAVSIEAGDGMTLRRSGSIFGFGADLVLGTSAAGTGTFRVNFAAGNFVDISATGVVNITYANSNTVIFQSTDFVGTGKAVRLREMDFCESGVARKRLVLCSAAY